MKTLKALLIGCCTAALAWAGTAGFVVRVEGDRVTVNRGTMDSVKVGDHLMMVRGGRPIGELVVQDVNMNESSGKVLKLFGQEPVLAGDAVSMGGTLAPNVTNAAENVKSRLLTPIQVNMQESQQAYKDLLGSRTQKVEFQQKWSGRTGNTPDLNQYTTSGALDALGYGLIGGGWWNGVDQLMRTGNMMLMNQQLHDRMSRDYAVRVELEVTRWDNDLLEAYSKMQAAQQGLGSAEEFAALKAQIAREKGLDRNDVFQVRVRNTGELNAELSPFHWHMFLSAPDNKKVVATSYDTVLDRKLTAKQEVVGYIKFPKVEGRSGTTVFFEDIYGDSQEISF